MIAPQLWLKHGHISTIYASQFRKPSSLPFTRRRITTPDDDFLDCDWIESPDHRKLLVLSHGLEGSSRRPYIQGMANAFYSEGFDVLAWNYRSCSGEINRQRISYHSGVSYDLKTVLEQADAQKSYDDIVLVGFSMGGNITLKFCGEEADDIDSRIRAVVTFSVPLDLSSSCDRLSAGMSRLYTKNFLRTLIPKVHAKKKWLPEIDLTALQKIKTLREFDDMVTAPVHGFRDAEDYYQRCSAKNFLQTIAVPTLVVNAQNDPFLSPACFPQDVFAKKPNLCLRTPRWGGHVAFMESAGQEPTPAERWALEFAIRR